MMSMDSGSGGNQDFELNLASMIDCFTVLITFLLISASFVSIGVLDAGVAAPSEAGAQAETSPNALELNLSIETDRSLRVEVARNDGKAVETVQVPAQAGKLDTKAALELIGGLQAKHKEIKTATLAANDEIPYREVVLAMDALRPKLPSLLLGGFGQ